MERKRYGISYFNKGEYFYKEEKRYKYLGSFHANGKWWYEYCDANDEDDDFVTDVNEIVYKTPLKNEL